MRSTGLVLMTALPPTEGHVALVRFSAAFMAALDGRVRVLVCVLPDEPPGRAEHVECLRKALGYGCGNVDVEIQFSNDQQGPISDDDDAFWTHWVQVVTRQHAETITHVFSSEDYGPRLAASLGAEHIPYDAQRDTVRVRATDVREMLLHEHGPMYGRLVRPLRDALRRRVVTFGQESTFKTSVARRLAERFRSPWVPEWARPYLESLPTPEVTQERMMNIVRGQAAAECAGAQLAEETGAPFLFLDTDLMSTLGYQQHWCQARAGDRVRLSPGYITSGLGGMGGGGAERDLNEVWGALQNVHMQADLYLVMSDTAPFVPDPLRYGGDRRETTREYWVSLLEERGYSYRLIESSEPDDVFLEATDRCLELMEARAGFVNYRRRR